MQYLKIHNSQLIAIVDDDFAFDSKLYLNSSGYAITNHRQYLHSLLMPSKKGFDVDHINRNKLDNRRCNLRYATRSVNRHNAVKQKNNSSGYKNISRSRNAWRVQLSINRKYILVGLFSDIQEAIIARDAARKQLCRA